MLSPIRKVTATGMMFLALVCAGMAQDSTTQPKDAKPADAKPATDQTAAPAPAPAPADAPAPLPTPSITGPLSGAVPYTLEAGPLGKLSLDGAVTGMGLFQSNAVPGNETANGALTNGMIWIQKTTGWWQFYLQAGAYELPALGAAFLSTEQSLSNLYGPVPVAFLKFVPGKNTNILIGSLPTLVGAEYTFTFQNMNIERGLLWGQEQAVSKGIQINQTIGKFAASFAWTDNYYSNRYSGLSGLLSYTNGPHSVAFVGSGYLGTTNWTSLSTPLQNNGMIYNIIYTYTKGPWIISPYVQWNSVPAIPQLGVWRSTSAVGGAVLATYKWSKGFSLAGRFEYISSSGDPFRGYANLLYGPGSAAWSITATPTYQYQKFFVRGDIAVVQAVNSVSGFAFGSNGTNDTQTRGVVELGFLF
jgi:hypothetical protein